MDKRLRRSTIAIVLNPRSPTVQKRDIMDATAVSATTTPIFLRREVRKDGQPKKSVLHIQNGTRTLSYKGYENGKPWDGIEEDGVVLRRPKNKRKLSRSSAKEFIIRRLSRFAGFLGN